MKQLMRGLVANRDGVELRTSLAAPEPAAGEVLIQVHAVGLCRTDLYVMAGQVPAKPDVIPGHEFAGVVVGVGSGVRTARVGQRVVVDPLIACGRCQNCEAGHADDCQLTTFLGVDCDGACAELIAIPESAVFPIPAAIPWQAAVFAEPLAATLSVFKADIRAEQRGLIFGESRIAELTLRMLQASGFSSVQLCADDAAGSLPRNYFDFIVETFASSETLATMIDLLKPRGRIVFKSRQYRPVSFVLRDILAKEPVFQFVHYGRFAEAIDWLASGRIDLTDLIGNSYPLEQFERAIAEAHRGESRKTFLIPSAG